jgi:hypothetical protein
LVSFTVNEELSVKIVLRKLSPNLALEGKEKKELPNPVSFSEGKSHFLPHFNTLLLANSYLQ